MTPAGPSPQRIVFVNRFFYPDQSATSQILTDVAFLLAASGSREVAVVCARASYEKAMNLPADEQVNGVTVRRVVTTRFGRGALLGRALDYLSFYVSASWRVLLQLRQGDVLVVKTDPPLLSVPLGFVARLKGAILVNWLQDLYPEVAAELGVGLAKGPVGGVLRALRNRSLRKAALNVTIGEQMSKRLIDMRVPSSQVIKIENFTDDRAIRPLSDHASGLRSDWGFSDRDFIVGYSGNLGRAHDIDTLLGAAETLRVHPHIKFLFIGGGHLREQLGQVQNARGLSNIFVRPYQPREALPASLGLPNLHWVSLRPELEGLIVPSKLYGIAAAGRPVIMVGSPSGEIADLLSRHGFGVTVEPGDSDTLADHITDVASDPERVATLSLAARRYVDRYANRQIAFERWELALDGLATQPVVARARRSAPLS